MTENIFKLAGDIAFMEHSAAAGIVNVMIYICYPVGQRNNFPFKRFGCFITAVAGDAVKNLVCKIQTAAVALNALGNAHTL